MRLILFFLVALLTACQANEEAEKGELHRLEAHIEQLEEEIQSYQVLEFKEMMDSQESMLADWKEFAKNVEEAELWDQRAEEIGLELEQLKKKKQQILDSLENSSKNSST